MLLYLFIFFTEVGTGQANFFPQNANPQILRLIPLSQIRQFLECAGPQIKSANFHV
jgi:hypothetical protein